MSQVFVVVQGGAKEEILMSLSFGGELQGSRITTSMKGFNVFIRDCGLRDIALSNAQLTWFGYEGKLVATCINKFLFTNDWRMNSSIKLQIIFLWSLSKI